MRLIIKYDHGSQDSYTEVTRPIRYESKEKFLKEFESKFNEITITNFHDTYPFLIGDYKFYHEEHRIMTFKNHPDLPKYLDYDDVSNFTIDVKLPMVYTVDEWFEKVENE